jgi:hypothetical protein
MYKSKLPQTPEQGIKALEQQLAESQLKRQFFEAVVNVLETDYGVRLTKKHKEKLSSKKR